MISFVNKSPSPIKIKPKYKMKIEKKRNFLLLFVTYDHPSGTIVMFLLPNDGITAKEQDSSFHNNTSNAIVCRGQGTQYMFSKA